MAHNTIVLKDRKLSFIDRGKRGETIHMSSTGGLPENKYVNMTHKTLCGLPTDETIESIKARELDQDCVCGKCIRTAKRFPDWMAVVEDQDDRAGL